MCHSISRESAALRASSPIAIVAIDDASRDAAGTAPWAGAIGLWMLERSGSGQGPPGILRKPNRRDLAAAPSKPA